jgi:hypothetical protein
MKAKLFIGPMSKNIVDAIIEYSNNKNTQLGIIPSRRQIEIDGGYVNNWTTKDFCNYIKKKSENVLLVRDHAGPSQGYSEDDGIESFKEDCKFFDVVHVDVWKKNKTYEDGLKATIDMITIGYNENPNLSYEIGTEEAIRPFTPDELDNLITDLKSKLPKEIYDKVMYVVIQSGTALKGNKNIGKYDNSRLIKMLDVVKKHGLISKEHNGDYIDDYILKDKFTSGLNSINVAPEFGQLETKIILDEIKNNQELIDKFYQICYDSKRWVKWVSSDFIPSENKLELINICGHYVFSNPDFIEIKKSINSDIDVKIKNKIIERIDRFISNIEINKTEILNSYFELFSNKNIEKLSKIFDENIKLVDWEISADGKEAVIKANQNIFNNVDTIKVNVINIFEKENEFSCQLIITINETEKIDVVDIIKFKNNKIISIKAYKG